MGHGLACLGGVYIIQSPPGRPPPAASGVAGVTAAAAAAAAAEAAAEAAGPTQEQHKNVFRGRAAGE